MEGTLHFQYLLSAGGGLVEVADTYDEHAARLAEALSASHPEGCVSERSTRFVEAFIRPYGVDQPATPRMVEMIESLPERPKTARASRGTPVIGPMLVSVMRKRHAKMIDRVRSDKAERIGWLKSTGRPRRRARPTARPRPPARPVPRRLRLRGGQPVRNHADAAELPKSDNPERPENAGVAGVADRPERTGADTTDQDGVTGDTDLTLPGDSAPPSPSSQRS